MDLRVSALVSAVQNDVLRGMEAEPKPLRAGKSADVFQVGPAVVDHGVKLRQVRVRVVRGKFAAHAVHAYVMPAQVFERFAEIAKRDAQVRIAPPATRVVALQVRPSHHLDRKAETHGFGREGRHGQAVLVGLGPAARRHGMRQTALFRGGGLGLLTLARGLYAGALLCGLLGCLALDFALLLRGRERLCFFLRDGLWG